MLEASQMRSQDGSAILSIPGGWVGVLAVLLLNSCGPVSCDKTLQQQPSSDGRFIGSIVEAGNCVSSLNTVVVDVRVTDKQAWVRGSATVFSAKGVSEVQLRWLAPTRLQVTYSYPGQVPERILARGESWRGVSIVYKELPWSGDR